MNNNSPKNVQGLVSSNKVVSYQEAASMATESFQMGQILFNSDHYTSQQCNRYSYNFGNYTHVILTKSIYALIMMHYVVQ